MHDWWLGVAVSKHIGVNDVIRKPTIMYRQHGNNTLGAKFLMYTILKIRLFI